MVFSILSQAKYEHDARGMRIISSINFPPGKILKQGHIQYTTLARIFRQLKGIPTTFPHPLLILPYYAILAVPNDNIGHGSTLCSKRRVWITNDSISIHLTILSGRWNRFVKFSGGITCQLMCIGVVVETNKSPCCYHSG